MGKFLLRVGFFLVGFIASAYVLFQLDPWGAFQGELPCVKEARARLANHNEAVARAAREKRPKPKAPEIDMAAYESCAKASNAERSYFRYAFSQLSVLTGLWRHFCYLGS